MPYCPKCREQVTETQLFCGKCWTPFSQAAGAGGARSADMRGDRAGTPVAALKHRPPHPRLTFFIVLGVVFLLFFWLKVALERTDFVSEFDELSGLEREQRIQERSAELGLPAFSCDDLNRIIPGMTYEQVESMLGGRGTPFRPQFELPSSFMKPGTRAYAWKRLDGAEIVCFFQDNRVVTKFLNHTRPRPEFHRYVVRPQAR